MRQRPKLLFEDVPTNNVSGGNIAATGIGPQGEPPKKMKQKAFLLFRSQLQKKKQPPK